MSDFERPGETTVPPNLRENFDEPISDQSSWPDERLVSECLKGNDLAWSVLVDRYKALVFSVPVRFGLPADASKEVFQEVWLSLLSELRNIRDPRALVAWLAQTAWHKCMHSKRTTVRHTGIPLEPQPDMVIDPAALPEEWMEEIEQEQVMREAIAALPSRCARMIQMLFFDMPTVPYQEVAAELKLAVGSIGLVRRRCLDRLKVELKKRGIA